MEKGTGALNNLLLKLFIGQLKPKKESLLSLSVKDCDESLEPKRAVSSAIIIGVPLSLHSSSGPEVTCATIAQRPWAAPAARKTMADSQVQIKLK